VLLLLLLLLHCVDVQAANTQCVPAHVVHTASCAAYSTIDPQVAFASIALYDTTGHIWAGCIHKAKRDCLNTNYPIYFKHGYSGAAPKICQPSIAPSLNCSTLYLRERESSYIWVQSPS
jgi:hypothetical protein